jgi:putative transcriptional regulator
MDVRRLVAILAYFVVAAVAIEPTDEPVILVAKRALRDRLYGETILVTKPVGNDEHIGFIVNKPTRMTLSKLFPSHEPSRKVTDPVYLGGPVNTEMLFALVQRRDSPGGRSMQLTPDLYLVIERELVDRVIEAEASNARFFAGLVLWAPGELRAELKRGLWFVLDADASLVVREPTEGMWEDLVRRSEEDARAIRADATATETYARFSPVTRDW